MIKRGPSEDSNGELVVTINPVQGQLRCISLLDRGELESITGIIWNAKEEFGAVTTC